MIYLIHFLDLLYDTVKHLPTTQGLNKYTFDSLTHSVSIQLILSTSSYNK